MSMNGDSLSLQGRRNRPNSKTKPQAAPFHPSEAQIKTEYMKTLIANNAGYFRSKCKQPKM